MQFAFVERKTSDSVREYVYKVLKNSIMFLDLEPGTNITEKDIAEKLNVSRTPVREALIKLSQEDLLDIYPQKGTVVSLIDLGHVEEARFIRRNLEVATMESACTSFADSCLFELQSNLNSMQFQVRQSNIDSIALFKLDEDFHRIIFKGCRKERAWSVISQVSTHLDRVRILKLKASSTVWDRVLEQHTAIEEAIKEKDTKKGVAVIDEHLGGLDLELEKIREQNSRYFK